MRVDVLLDLLDKTVNDPQFRAAAERDAATAVARLGYTLSAAEMLAFQDFHDKAVRQSAEMLV